MGLTFIIPHFNFYVSWIYFEFTHTFTEWSFKQGERFFRVSIVFQQLCQKNNYGADRKLKLIPRTNLVQYFKSFFFLLSNGSLKINFSQINQYGFFVVLWIANTGYHSTQFRNFDPTLLTTANINFCELFA